MNKDIYKPGPRLKLSIAGVVMEGLISGLNFLVLLKVLDLIFLKSISFSDILKATYILAIIFVLRLFLYSISYTQSQIGGASVSRGLRVALGDKLRKIPLGLFTKQRTGFYINAATSEVADYEQILTHKLADIVKYVVLTSVLSLYCLSLNIYVGIIMIISLLLIIPTNLLSKRQVAIHGKRKNLAREENVSAITEYLTGSQCLRSYGLVGKKNESLTKSMKAYSDISYAYERAVIPIGVTYNFIVNVGVACGIVMSTMSYIKGSLMLSQVIILAMMMIFASKVFTTLFISLVSYRNLLISKGKTEKIFSEPEVTRHETEFNPNGYDISFKNVSFEYLENEPVLKDVSFTAKENTMTAIVGDSGSGKSTIFNLLSCYYEPENGTITVGGVDSKTVDCEKLLSVISIVDQNVFLFNDTVINNIRYANPNATDEQIKEACRLANCDDFIMHLENGYDTSIGENGNKLSGGERQRLSIARAIVRNSPIILLDEATASLDIENELLVKEAVKNLLKADKTVLMIAHTLPIIEEADKILVLDGGVIKESGTHEELIKLNGKYARMWKAEEMVK